MVSECGGAAEHTQREQTAMKRKEGRKEGRSKFNKESEENGAIIHYKLNTLDDNEIAFHGHGFFLRCQLEAEMRLSLIDVLEKVDVIHNL